MSKFEPEFNEKNQEKVNGKWVYTAKSLVRIYRCSNKKAGEMLDELEAMWEFNHKGGDDKFPSDPIKTVHREDVPTRPKIRIMSSEYFEEVLNFNKIARKLPGAPHAIDREKNNEIIQRLGLRSADPVDAYMALYTTRKPMAEKIVDKCYEIFGLKKKIFYLCMENEKTKEEIFNNGYTEPFPNVVITLDDFPPEHEYMVDGKRQRARGPVILSDFINLEDIQ